MNINLSLRLIYLTCIPSFRDKTSIFYNNFLLLLNTSNKPSSRAVLEVTDLQVFSPSIYQGPSAKRAGHKTIGKKRGSVTYGTDRQNEVDKIFIISLLFV